MEKSVTPMDGECNRSRGMNQSGEVVQRISNDYAQSLPQVTTANFLYDLHGLSKFVPVSIFSNNFKLIPRILGSLQK